MKKLYYFLILSVILCVSSCDKKVTEEDDTPPVIITYDITKMTVTSRDTLTGVISVSLVAKDVKGLGLLTVGICYSTNAEPTVADTHLEITFNSDTLKKADLKLTYLISSLTRDIDYNLKGYLVTLSDTYYSAKKSFKVKINILTIKVSSDYIPLGNEYWAVLSNKSTTLLTQKLQNGQTYTFSDNIPATADIHLFEWNPTNSSLYVETYTYIVPDNFNLLNPYTTTPNVGQATVTVSDIANFLIWGASGSWYRHTTTLSTTKTLTPSLGKNPDEVFIFCIPSGGTAPLYKYVTNVIPGSTYTYTMSNLAAMTSSSDISLPANTYFDYNIAGFNTDYYTEYKRYHGYTYASGYTGTFKLYYPVGINTNYYFHANYIKANQRCYYIKLGSLPTTFFSTFPTITITNSSLFNTTTTTVNNFTNFEAAVVIGTYSNSTLDIQWDYYTQPLASNTVKIPDFPAEVKTKINNLSNTSLVFANAGFFDISNSQVTSYSSYVDLIVKKSSRLLDVVKERRIYYQWINKKSSVNVIKEFDLR